MNIVEELDLAIKKDEIGTTGGRYALSYKGKIYNKETYMTNAEWDAFLNAMPAEVKIEYGKGGGDELSEKRGSPPKMACYGSSSRMIYTLSRHNKDFHYEAKFHTTVGGTANLDGFYEDKEHYVFVEAKCHEPYTIKRNEISECYKGVYEYINKRMTDKFVIKMNPSKKEGNMDVAYFAGKEKLVRMDMKQMICHLLGVATGFLKGKLEKKQTDFIYLFYDPTTLPIALAAKTKIGEIYAQTCRECGLVDFKELFGVILDFLRETKFAGVMSDRDAADIVSKFTFTLQSQKTYRI